MEAVAFLFYYVTPYITVAGFLGGIAYRLCQWRQKRPVSAHLSLFPRPQSRLGRLADALVDMFTLKGLWQVNKPLWAGGFVMHVGLLLLLVGQQTSVSFGVRYRRRRRDIIVLYIAKIF